jgi:hypothetical protein
MTQFFHLWLQMASWKRLIRDHSIIIHVVLAKVIVKNSSTQFVLLLNCYQHTRSLQKVKHISCFFFFLNKYIAGRYLEPFYFSLCHSFILEPWDSTYEAANVFKIDELNEVKHYNKQEMPSVNNDTLGYLNLYKEVKINNQCWLD